jgi:hypothetical protein
MRFRRSAHSSIAACAPDVVATGRSPPAGGDPRQAQVCSGTPRSRATALMARARATSGNQARARVVAPPRPMPSTSRRRFQGAVLVRAHEAGNADGPRDHQSADNVDDGPARRCRWSASTVARTWAIGRRHGGPRHAPPAMLRRTGNGARTKRPRRYLRFGRGADETAEDTHPSGAGRLISQKSDSKPEEPAFREVPAPQWTWPLRCLAKISSSGSNSNTRCSAAKGSP